MLSALVRRGVESVVYSIPRRNGSIMPAAPGGNWRTPIFPQETTNLMGCQGKPAPFTGPAEITAKLNETIAPQWEFYAYAATMFAAGAWVGWRADAELMVVLVRHFLSLFLSHSVTLSCSGLGAAFYYSSLRGCIVSYELCSLLPLLILRSFFSGYHQAWCSLSVPTCEQLVSTTAVATRCT